MIFCHEFILVLSEKRLFSRDNSDTFQVFNLSSFLRNSAQVKMFMFCVW